MKVLIVSDANSIHTYRWVTSLAERGLGMVLYSITPVEKFSYPSDVSVYSYDLFGYRRRKNRIVSAFFSLHAHMHAVSELRRIIRFEKPDILHAHYVTSYAFIAALSGFHPFVVSVWGSDIYEFPKKSPINRKAVEFVLGRADRVLSTSQVMAEETQRYLHADIGITPFGVDTSHFRNRRCRVNDSCSHESRIVFGTVKTLSRKYGIDTLIKAYSSMRKSAPEMEASLAIVGDGPDRKSLERLASDTGYGDEITFYGYVDNSLLPDVYSGFDVAVFLSREESFGVSVVEAMSCGIPVIASSAKGFTEVIEDGVTGIIVPSEDPDAAAAAMKKLAADGNLRREFSVAARLRVEEHYGWKDNVGTMVSEYLKILEK